MMVGQNPKPKDATLALLIDADNAHPKHIDVLLAEAAKNGVICLRRAYGDWTNPHLTHWKECLLVHSIQPIQQFAYTTGKNATDAAMIIDAMDLLYTDRFDGFCLVSSDSDFTPLAVRIRGQGLKVYGFGQSQTPRPFVKACDSFFFVNESDTPKEAALTIPAPKPPTPPQPLAKAVPATKPKTSPAALESLPAQAAPLVEESVGKDLHSLLRAAVATASDEKGWANLTTLGNHLRKQAPDFTSQKYGYKRLSDLVEATKLFEVDKSKGPTSLRVRLKTVASVASS